MIRIKLIHSYIGLKPAQRKVLAALGLTKREMVKVHKDNAAIRGMIDKVKHLVEVGAA